MLQSLKDSVEGLAKGQAELGKRLNRVEAISTESEASAAPASELAAKGGEPRVQRSKLVRRDTRAALGGAANKFLRV